MKKRSEDERKKVLFQLIETVRRLRAPGGCPWDSAQTHQSLRPYLIEEAYEVLDVLDRIHSTGDLKKPAIRRAFCEELGDLLMQVVLHSAMVAETGTFDIYDVAEGLDRKLLRRHPHVFGEDKAANAEAALKTWEKQKAKERAGNPRASILDGVPKSLPALQKTARVIERATKVGFQWSDLQGPLAKVDEELQELKHELSALDRLERGRGDRARAAELRKKASGELGDLLFSICNLAYLTKVAPEDSLRGTLARFESRFRHVERRLAARGKAPDESTLEEMDVLWNEAKAIERRGKKRSKKARTR